MELSEKRNISVDDFMELSKHCSKRSSSFTLLDLDLNSNNNNNYNNYNNLNSFSNCIDSDNKFSSKENLGEESRQPLNLLCCFLCNNPLQKENEDLAFLSCDHCFHRSCLEVHLVDFLYNNLYNASSLSSMIPCPCATCEMTFNELEIRFPLNTNNPDGGNDVSAVKIDLKSTIDYIHGADFSEHFQWAISFLLVGFGLGSEDSLTPPEHQVLICFVERIETLSNELHANLFDPDNLNEIDVLTFNLLMQVILASF
jgi:hypothetical protein